MDSYCHKTLNAFIRQEILNYSDPSVSLTVSKIRPTKTDDIFGHDL